MGSSCSGSLCPFPWFQTYFGPTGLLSIHVHTLECTTPTKAVTQNVWYYSQLIQSCVPPPWLRAKHGNLPHCSIPGAVPALPVMCNTPTQNYYSQVFSLAPICFRCLICAKVPSNGGANSYLKCWHWGRAGWVGRGWGSVVPSLPHTSHNSDVVYMLFTWYK